MLDINNDADEVASRIAAQRHVCKVLLKTADESILLPIWLAHYTKLFAPAQIVIADNGSRDPKVLGLYSKLPPDLTVFNYASGAGYHNNIHDRDQFGPLYAAFRKSCDYLLSVDTDELLYVADDKGWTLDRGRIETRLRRAGGKAVSTTWIHNARRSLDTFYVGRDTQRLAWDLRWGKPFVPSGFAEGGINIHNIQFPRQMFDRDLGADFFLLHLIYYSQEQRLRANKQKLISRHAARPDDTFETIVARNYDKVLDPTIPRLVGEIAGLLKETWKPSASPVLEPVCARFAAGGRVEYGSAEAARAWAAFRADFAALFAEASIP